MHRVYRYILCCILLFVSITAWAQTDALQKHVSFSVQGKTLQQTLTLLGDKAEFSFAYNSELIPADSLINYTATDKSVNEILNDLLGNAFSYTSVGGHVILQPKQPETIKQRPSFAVSGQVFNASTGQSIEDVSVYSSAKLRSGITDEAGNYQLKLTERDPVQTLHISKIGYQDTTVVVSISEIYNLDIKLIPKAPTTGELLQVELDKVCKKFRGGAQKIEELKVVKLFTNRKQRVNALNIGDSITRPIQFSFLPILGTNFRMSGVVTNNLSINFIGGYNGGVKGLEMAVGFNIVRHQVVGIQLSTLMNVVGGDVRAGQFTAFLNLNLQNMKGWQAAAFMNIQVKRFAGLQTAAFMNFTGGTMAGVQAAAGANYADTVKGIQVSSGINIAKSEVRGLQVSAGVNYTKHLRGVQLGIINFADTATGIPIGLLSIVPKGYWHFDLYADELTYVNTSIRTGVSYFHNIISVGYAWSAPTVLWRIGYGVGTEFKLGKKERGFTNFDLTVSYINRGSKFITDLNILTTFNWDFGFRVKEHAGIFFGPTVKVYNTQYLNPNTNELGMDIAWNPVFSNIKSGQLNQVWVGFRGGLRF